MKGLVSRFKAARPFHPPSGFMQTYRLAPFPGSPQPSVLPRRPCVRQAFLEIALERCFAKEAFPPSIPSFASLASLVLWQGARFVQRSSESMASDGCKAPGSLGWTCTRAPPFAFVFDLPASAVTMTSKTLAADYWIRSGTAPPFHYAFLASFCAQGPLDFMIQRASPSYSRNDLKHTRRKRAVLFDRLSNNNVKRVLLSAHSLLHPPVFH